MSKNLVIVESPTKAKTIGGFLGSGYKVLSSMGHIRDLPESKLGVDTENDFEPTYVIPPDKKKVVDEIKKNLGKDTVVWLATDEDREGEAISWHLCHALKVKEKETKRIVFHEITKSAIEEAIKNPRTIDINLVDAQQARRILDRLVGYKLSPLLWKKIVRGISAGRVQSVCVRLICEREREIDAFKTEESWTIEAYFNKEKIVFDASLKKYQDKKIELAKEKDANKVLADLDGATYQIVKIEQKDVKKSPAPPFTTSTLQQEAARKLGFSVKKTMMIAQQLYEGIKGEGLITYMRTDSLNLAESALKEAASVIQKTYGKEYALKTPRRFKTKSKGAQEAHEAIRPVHISKTPDQVSGILSPDQSRLYELIWNRTVACQMAEAKIKRTTVDIAAKDYLFRAIGRVIVFPGFLAVYEEGKDDSSRSAREEKTLPPLAEGDKLNLDRLEKTQHFTEPPPRYTEASLVKKLEAEGIGRPSTYAPTITTIQRRGYIEREGHSLKPTEIAFVVNDFLVAHFPQIVDLKFTALMEEELDEIAEGKKKWQPVIREFYGPFEKLLLEKELTIDKKDLTEEDSKEICERCGAPMKLKLGRFGKFLACSNYPECRFRKSVDGDKPQSVTLDEKCPECGNPLEKKMGRFGEFVGCSNYPKCRYIRAIVKDTGIACPECGKGKIVEKRTKKGRTFYSCDQYPKCQTAFWNKPVDKKCPKCGKQMVEAGKSAIKCSDTKECGHKEGL